MPTYYVDGAVGNDGNAGTSEGAGNAWATIGKAASTVAASDTVYIKASATYSEDVTISTAGTIAAPSIYEGYTSTVGDNGKVTVSGTTQCLTLPALATYHIFKNMIFTGASGLGVGPSTADHLGFYNCEFTSNGSHGIDVDDSVSFVNCVAHSNTGRGFSADNYTMLIGCTAYGNSDHQFNIISGFIYKCLGYGLAASKRNVTLTSDTYVVACTFDGENAATTTGIYQDPYYEGAIVDNIIYDHNLGVNLNVISTERTNIVIAYNLLNSNTTDYDATGGEIGYQDVTSAPAFTDEAGDDYRPSSSSPAVDAQLKPGGIT